MLDPTSPAWAAANPTPPQAFFALLWEQLCGGATLDSWQLRAMNLPALLHEVIDVCAVARSFPPLQRALSDVLGEASSVSHRDPVLKDHFRVATATLEDPKLRESSPTALVHAEHTALHLLDTLRPYPELVRRELERLLGDQAVREKKRLSWVLAAPLQYHALGVQAVAPESRLTNFWVALESLLVDHEGAIIEKVTKYIPPSLALSYCSRLLRANAIQLAAFVRAASRQGLAEAVGLRTLLNLARHGRVSIEPAALAELLVDDSRASRLLALCAKNPLLIFRLNQMREMIRSPSELKQALEGHREGVGWQLGRIYRARNSLVHRGTLPRRAEHLIQHLHTYLSMTLHYLVREIADSTILTVAAAFARRRALYDVYLAKVTDKSLTYRNLTSEATCWLATSEAPIWPVV